jgi:Glycosyl hydrolase catalytic core
MLALLLMVLAGCGSTGDAGKRGVGTWGFDGVERALAEAGVTWYYTWSPAPGSLAAPPGVAFVPMIWGADRVRRPDLDAAARNGDTLLGFNEPDVADQSALSVEQALDLWPQLMTTGQRLGSPAVSADAATPGSWLDSFMTGAASRGYRVDFIAVHWYGRNPATAVRDLAAYLQAIHDRYHRPIWLTEFALADFSGAQQHYAPRTEQAAFAAEAVPLLDRLSYVERYAWFALADSDTDHQTGLFDANGNPTTILPNYDR